MSPAFLVFGCALIYAFLRYIVFGGVALEQIPSFILNKVFAAATAVALFAAALHYAKGRSGHFQRWAMISFAFAAAHVLLSASLWSRAYYPKLFGPDKMNWAGELTLLFGVGTAWTYGAVVFMKVRNLRLLRWLSAALMGLHALALGFSGWLTPGQWPGGMPPISLISALLAGFATGLFLLPPPANHAAER